MSLLNRFGDTSRPQAAPFRPQLEILERRDLPSGFGEPAPLPVLPNFPNLPSFGKIVTDVASVALDAMTFVSDTIITADLAILSTGKLPPPQLFAMGVLAEDVSGALKAPSTILGINSLWTHAVEEHDWGHVALDINGLIPKILPALITDLDSYWHDAADLRNDIQAIFGSPPPSPHPAPPTTPTTPPKPQPPPSGGGIGGGNGVDFDDDGDADPPPFNYDPVWDPI